MEIKIPELSLVLLVGPSACGKSTFAEKHFLTTEIISSDACRAMVSDDENCIDATADAFSIVHEIAAKRLKRGKFTVIDATNLQEDARKPLRLLAKKYHFFPVIIAFNVHKSTCQKRNKKRERIVPSNVIHWQHELFKSATKKLKNEGFRYIYKLNENEIDKTTFIRQTLWNNRKEECGPFDIIGDVHGCISELIMLLEKLGYKINKENDSYKITSNGRKLLFVGDLVDRGPDSVEVLRLVMEMVKTNIALCVPGNHDAKLMRKLKGRDVKLNHGLAETIAQLEKESPEFREKVKTFIDNLISHYVFDKGNLVISHAGIKENMQGRGSKTIRAFCLYGETTGETDEFGLPVRHNWAINYNGKSTVVYGHTPVVQPEWLNNTLNIDTGCVFGGKLTALRYPEKELISIKSLAQYSDPIRPIGTGMSQKLTTQQEYDDILNVEDYLQKFFVNTRLRKVTIRSENAPAALETMTRYALHPKWLIYLPATMSPCETSSNPSYLEHPIEGFDYYANNNIKKVICQEKHMGSRSIVILCKDKKTVLERFGLDENRLGVCYTRSGRNFFEDQKLEQDFFERLNKAFTASKFWETHNTNWVCLDCELMPWSIKAQSLLKKQYAAVATASRIATPHVINSLKQVQKRGIEVQQEIDKYQNRQELLDSYTEVYRRYCWPVKSTNDLKLAPFHILATENNTHTDKNHQWHMENIATICEADPEMLMKTQWKILNPANPEEIRETCHWWEKLTASGKEGMVIKPIDFISYNGKKLLQPAIKCRGRDYLRITYGAEYTLPENIDKLKNRFLKRKQNLALQEFSLGIESLERFIAKKPLRAIHECIFAILALESDAIDPRL